MTTTRAILILCLAVLLPTATAAQHAHGDHALKERGKRFMGFDQDKTRHRFVLLADGGRIEVAATDPRDVTSVDAIRQHLRHIAAVFGAGDFNLPGLVHDMKSVPGVEAMRQHKTSLTFAFNQTDRGGQVRITGARPDAIAAVHEFLRFQITDHRTGDSLTVR